MLTGSSLMNKNLLMPHDLWYASRGQMNQNPTITVFGLIGSSQQTIQIFQWGKSKWLRIQQLISANLSYSKWLFTLWPCLCQLLHRKNSWNIQVCMGWSGSHRERQKSIFLHLNGLSFLALTVTKSICYFKRLFPAHNFFIFTLLRCSKVEKY